VPQYLQAAGIDIIPILTFYPDVTTTLGVPVLRDLRAVPPPVDILCVFRKPSDVPPHVPDMLALRPACVWLQSGIRAPEAERQLAEAGIRVVADRCLMVEHRQARLLSGL